MTCFTVRSNIHPTSAPTGTDDDIEGNNKADALYWDRRGGEKTGVQAVSAILFSNPEVSNVAVIYDIPRSGMHL
jgi:hypothetical protein